MSPTCHVFQQHWRALLTALLVVSFCPQLHALIVVVEGRECFTQVAVTGDLVTGSFVVIDIDSSWRDDIAAVDFNIHQPDGKAIYQVSEREEDVFEFRAVHTGLYQFCLEQKSHHVATVELSFQIGHVELSEDLAKDDHMVELLEHLEIIRNDLAHIEQDQAFFRARDHRRKLTHQSTNRRIFYYALLETGVLVGASLLQVYVLRSLFERQLRKYSQA